MSLPKSGDQPPEVFSQLIPGALIAPIILGDWRALEREFRRMSASSHLLDACAELAASSGRISVLELLLGMGWKVNGDSALKFATSGGWTQAVDFLLAHGASIEGIGPELTVRAARSGHLATLEYLNAAGCSLESCASLLPDIARKPSRRAVFDFLAGKGVLPDAARVLTAVAAVRGADAEAVEPAIRGLDARLAARLLIEEAASCDRVEALAILERNGCSMAEHGRHALLAAVQHGALSVVRHLVGRGLADESLRDEMGKLSIELGHASLAEFLIGAGYRPDRIPEATLRLATLNGHQEVIGLLEGQGVALTDAFRGRSGGATPRPQPSISLLLANYNNAVFLRASLQAFLSQTRLPDEIIIVDDGSSDESVEVIRSFTLAFPRTRLLRHARNLGQHAAIQRALVEARSDYVVWAASDDLLLPRFIEKAFDALTAHPGIGLCFSRLCAWREDTGEVREFGRSTHGPAFDLGDRTRSFTPQELQEELRHRYLWISGNTVAARRDALLAMGGFDPRLRWHADWFAFYAIALRLGACAIPERLAMMREREETYSRDGMVDRTAQRTVLRSMIDILRAPENADLYAAFKDCPPLLSPFGAPILLANADRPKSWPLIVPLFLWLLPRKIMQRLRRLLGLLRAGIGHAVRAALRLAKYCLFAIGRKTASKKLRKTILAILRTRRARTLLRRKSRAAARVARKSAAERSHHS